eukprot:COSAG04_NODE_8350_length_987_cov_1.222973_1_plen_94_part_10
MRAECVTTHKLVHVQLARELVHVQLLRERQPADRPPLARTLARRAQRNRRNRRLRLCYAGVSIYRTTGQLLRCPGFGDVGGGAAGDGGPGGAAG